MSFTTAWTRPSTLLLVAILAANLTLPLVHFWPERSEVRDDAAERAPSPPGRSAPRPGRSEPSSRPGEAPQAAAHAVEPVEVPGLARRPLPTAPAGMCRRWGPFDDAVEAEALATRLGLGAADFEVHPVDVEAQPEYLVTVQAAGPPRSATEIMRELQGRNIDSHVLDRPGSVLAVGVFRSTARAETQSRRMAELGYQTQIETLHRTRRVYHLLARIAADVEPAIPAAGPCGDIAPTNRFL